MVLYSADIMDIAEPVKSVKSRKRKVNDKIMLATTTPESPVKVKKTRKKAIPTPEPESPTPPPTPTPTPAPKKRKLKKVIEKVEPAKVEPVVEPVEKAEPVEKVELAEKVVETVAKPKRVRVKKDPTIAPQWFNKYVESVQKERQQLSETKVPAKQLKIESQEVAKKRWEDGLTRDRVHDEMNNHSN